MELPLIKLRRESTGTEQYRFNLNFKMMTFLLESDNHNTALYIMIFIYLLFIIIKQLSYKPAFDKNTNYKWSEWFYSTLLIFPFLVSAHFSYTNIVNSVLKGYTVRFQTTIFTVIFI